MTKLKIECVFVFNQLLQSSIVTYALYQYYWYAINGSSLKRFRATGLKTVMLYWDRRLQIPIVFFFYQDLSNLGSQLSLNRSLHFKTIPPAISFWGSEQNCNSDKEILILLHERCPEFHFPIFIHYILTECIHIFELPYVIDSAVNFI